MAFIDPLTRRWLRAPKYLSADKVRGPVILTYHGTPQHCSVREDVAPLELSTQLTLLLEAGWQFQTITEVLERRQNSPKTVILTFDDGYKNNLDITDFLIDNCIVATWFVVTGRLGKCATWHGSTTESGSLMDASDLIELKRRGMSVQCHSMNHVDLTKVSGDELRSEIRDAKDKLEEILDSNVSSFAYPFGRFNGSVVEMVKQSGFTSAFTTKSGWAYSSSDNFHFPRITMFAEDSLRTFARKVVFADAHVSDLMFLRYIYRRAVAKIKAH